MRPLLSIALLCLAGCGSGPGPQSVAAARDRTERNLDLAIDGDGFFIVQTAAGGFLFTRRGEFAVDANGEIVNADGYRLYPYIEVNAGIQLIVSPDGVVRRQVENGTPELVGQIVLSRFQNTGRLERDGEYCMPTVESGDPITGKPGMKGLGTLAVGELER